MAATWIGSLTNELVSTVFHSLDSSEKTIPTHSNGETEFRRAKRGSLSSELLASVTHQ